MDPLRQPGWRHLGTPKGCTHRQEQAAARAAAGRDDPPRTATGGEAPANGPPSPALSAACSKGTGEQEGEGGVLQWQGVFYSLSVCFLSVSESVIRGLITDNKFN